MNERQFLLHRSSFIIHHFRFMSAAIEHYISQCAPPAGAARGRAAWLIWGATVTCALLVLGLIAGAPLARANRHETFALIAYGAFSSLCHQQAARSFYLAGQPLAVCARCFGIYAGFAAGALCYPLVRRLGRRDMPARRWLLLAALPACVDFALGFTGWWANTHTSRALTGALLGATMSLYVMPGLLDFYWRLRRPRRADAFSLPRLTTSEGDS